MQPKPPLALAGMRIGLLGGSFNPAHEGHRHISVAALQRLRLHRLWWVVTPANPLKAKTDLASLAERVEAADKVASHPLIEVTDFEAALTRPFTVETLAHLKRRFPGVYFVWVMGGDNLAQFHRWNAWRRIFHIMPIAVMDRPGERLKALSSPAARQFANARLPEREAAALPLMKPPAWTYLTIHLSALSSSDLRKAGNR